MYNKAIKVFNQNVEKGKPFFGHIMTVSNHRPFTNSIDSTYLNLTIANYQSIGD